MKIRLVLTLITIGLASCTALGPANKSVPAFAIAPLTEEISTQSSIVQKGEVLIQQSVVPLMAARLEEPVVVYGNQTLPEGTNMFAAVGPEGTLYCSGKEKTDPEKRYKDYRGTLYCFRDDNQNGKFDRHYAIAGPVSAFPTFDTHRSPWIDIEEVQYSKVNTAEYPAKFLTGLELGNISRSKNSIQIRQFVKLEGQSKPPTYLGFRKKLTVGQDGIVKFAGSQMKVSIIDQNSITLEVLKPLAAGQFAIGYTPSRTFYVP